MKSKEFFFFLLIMLVAVNACSQHPEKNKNVTDYVDPFIGTGGHGHTFPGATVPFGMVQLSPDNPSKGWDWTSGYHYSDSILLGFSHTHLSGTGVGDLYDILFIPFTGNYPADTKNEHNRIYDVYDHDNESAEPGYYSVKLKRSNVAAELTATERTGFHKYVFPQKSNAQILIDLGYAQNFDKAVDTWMKIVDEKTIIGYRKSKGWAQFQPVYFVVEFSEPFTHKFFKAKTPSSGDEVKGAATEAVLKFETEKVLVKVSISSGSVDGARKNLAKEINHWDFEKTKKAASDKWAALLGKINVKGKNESEKRIFYTALYHSYIAPNLFMDENGEYYGADGKTQKAEGFRKYTLFSLWDTFRALHPLLTITEPQMVDDHVKSMLAFYDEYGLLPTWDLESNETNVMIGYHAVPVIVDAYLKGLTTAEPERIYEAIKTSAMQNNFGIEEYKKYGYIPSELELEAVSKVLEYSFDDWCIAVMAKELGNFKDYDYYKKRAESYKTLFDKSTGFMRGKDKNGNWVRNFNPIFVEHRKTDYTEANAWQYTWHVLQDVEGLINLFGSEKVFIQKLDSLFIISSDMEGEVSPDISGLIGQYAHGNEPCHHVGYLYSFTSQPWKTQDKINYIRKTMYRDDENGLIGNDDCGQMSAWYVFSALGFYPVNPADGKYWFGTPLFEEVNVRVQENKEFNILAKNISDKNIFIKSIKLNGKVLDRMYITHKEIMNGGRLVFEMTDKPNIN